jgi:hypothetical protein
VKLNGVIDSAAEARPAASRIRALAASRAAAPVLLGGLLLAAFVARFLLVRYVLAPWEMPDELEYAELAQGFNSTGHYLFREHEQHLRTIYPALISPAWFASSTHTAYTLIKLINVALMTLGAVPLYLWARRLVTPLWAVVVVVLYLAMPGFLYTGEILTENVFVPAAILAMFAIAAALERPTLLRQLLALGAIVLVSAARLQGLIFLIVLPTAILLALGLDAVAAPPGQRRGLVIERLRRFWPTLGALVLALVAFGVLALGRRGSISSGLGTYQQLSSAHYSLRPALRWIVFHFGELSFSVGLLPVMALIVLFGLACRRATAPGPAERAFLAVTVASLFWIVVQVGAFASRFTIRVEERYMFNLAPALFLALVIWLARGLPRPAGLTAAAVLVPVAFLLALPFESLFTEALFNDTYGLIPLWRLTLKLSGGPGEPRIIVGIGALVAGLLFASLRRGWARPAIPVAVFVFLLLSSQSVFGQIEELSAATRHAGHLERNPSWIDNAVGKDARVEVLDTTDILDPHVVWQAEFWNRSVRRIFGVTAQDPSIPDINAPLGKDGRISPGLAPRQDLHPGYVVAAPRVDVDGSGIARGGQLVLWRVHAPLRLRSSLTGVTPDGWTGSSASYKRFVVPSGASHLAIRVARPGVPAGFPPALVQATLEGRTATRTVRKRPVVLLLPVPHRPFVVTLTVSPTFSPAQFGSADKRTLGVRVWFSVR